MKALAAAVLFMSLPFAAPSASAGDPKPFSTPQVAACPGLELTDGWIREAPPGATVMAAYARLSNAGKAPLQFEQASSPGFGAVELHRTVIENGLARMLHGQSLRLAPGESTLLEPGGWHLMLFRPVRPLKAGDTISITLGCGDAGRPFSFTVKNNP